VGDAATSLAALLEQAKDGRLQRHDARIVADMLRAQSPDAYTAIHILGRASATDHRELVASFLDSSQDPQLARIALIVLVNHWGLGTEYRDRLRAFVKGVPWDGDDDVRLVALSAAGELARKIGDRELVSDLLEIAGDSHEDVLIRDTAFDAIARALGEDYSDLRRRSKLPADDPWADAMIDRARTFADGSE
jgi:hypothetical protein